jgi:hypothetical protein
MYGPLLRPIPDSGLGQQFDLNLNLKSPISTSRAAALVSRRSFSSKNMRGSAKVYLYIGPRQLADFSLHSCCTRLVTSPSKHAKQVLGHEGSSVRLEGLVQNVKLWQESVRDPVKVRPYWFVPGVR